MTREEAIETLKENFCAMCAYGSQSMMSCDIRGCDNRDAIKALEQESCEDKRLYIKIFADLEPDDIAEKIYQICDEDKFPKVIESLKEYFDSVPMEQTTEILLLRKDLRTLPPVTPQQKVGKWIIDDKEYRRIWHCHCSNCNKDPQDYIGGTENWWLVRLPDFCPNCGYRMKGEDE